jgi:tetratricopeptide (TPR) repeat protein
MEKLTEFLAENPQDMRALYALAMEYKSSGELETALDYFDRALQIDPGHVASYFQKALVLLNLGRTEPARLTLEAGIPKAIEAGQLHARDKMRELLEKLKP